MTRIMPFLTYGLPPIMSLLVDAFEPHTDFLAFDDSGDAEAEFHLAAFVSLAASIAADAAGDRLKGMICDRGVVEQAVAYLATHFAFPEKKDKDKDKKKDKKVRIVLFCFDMGGGC